MTTGAPVVPLEEPTVPSILSAALAISGVMFDIQRDRIKQKPDVNTFVIFSRKPLQKQKCVAEATQKNAQLRLLRRKPIAKTQVCLAEHAFLPN